MGPRWRIRQAAEFPDLPAPGQAAAKAGPIIRIVKSGMFACMGGVIVLFAAE